MANRGGASIRFIIRRMLRFYSGYWMVLLLFLPIGILAFNTPLCVDCGIKESIITWSKEILGIRGHDSYNPSWWFNALIISLYILFPLLYYSVKNVCILTLIVAYLLNHLSISHIGMDMGKYLFVFVIGMVFAVHAEKISLHMNKLPKWIVVGCCMLMLLFPMIILPMTDHGAIFYSGLTWFAVLTVGVFFLIVLCLRKCRVLSNILAYLGKHSANIYLIQSLIYYMWFSKFFYSLGSPYLIVFVLTLACLGLSIVLEALKRYSGYNKLFDYIISKI